MAGSLAGIALHHAVHESLVTVVLNSGLPAYGGDLYVGTVHRDAERDADGGHADQGITQGVQPIMKL